MNKEVDVTPHYTSEYGIRYCKMSDRIYSEFDYLSRRDEFRPCDLNLSLQYNSKSHKVKEFTYLRMALNDKCTIFTLSLRQDCYSAWNTRPISEMSHNKIPMCHIRDKVLTLREVSK